MPNGPTHFSKFLYHLLILYFLFFAIIPKYSHFVAILIAVVWILDSMSRRSYNFIKLPLFTEILLFSGIGIISYLVDVINHYPDGFPCFVLFPMAYIILATSVLSDEKRLKIIWSLIYGIAIASLLNILAHLQIGYDSFSNLLILDNYLSSSIYAVILLMTSLSVFSVNFSKKLFLMVLAIPMIFLLLYSKNHLAFIILLLLILICAVLKDRYLLGAIILSAAAIILFNPDAGDKFISQLSTQLNSTIAFYSKLHITLNDLTFFGSEIIGISNKLFAIESAPSIIRFIIIQGLLFTLIIIYIFYVQVIRYIVKLRMAPSELNIPIQFAGFLTTIYLILMCFVWNSLDMNSLGILIWSVWGLTET